METIFISGMPCSGKSHLTRRLVEHLGRDRAIRVPMDHYFLDATCPEHHDRSQMSGYQRERIDWDLLLSHLFRLARGVAVDTPRYDWNAMHRVPQDSGIGRSAHLMPCAIVLVDGMHPSLDASHKHVFVRTEVNAWQKVNDPLALDVALFCHQCGWT